MNRRLRSVIAWSIVSVLLSEVATPAFAQQLVSPPAASPTVQTPSRDSTLEVGIFRGRAAADQRSTVGNLVGGLAWGFFLGLIGTGIAYAIASGSDTSVPPEQAVRLTQAPPLFAQGFQAGFSERMKSRKKGAALTGGLLGTALIVLVFVSANSQ